MSSRVSADLVGGVALVATGAFAAGYAVHFYDIGTISRMGPGMFPFALGVVVAALGVLIGFSGWVRHTLPAEDISIRAVLGVLASVATFAFFARPFGVLPSVIAMTIVAALADGRFRPLRTVLLALVLTLLSWITFKVLLGVPFVMFRWPF